MARIDGTTDNDILYANNDASEVYGYDGNDRIYGGYSNDSLYGGNGNDYILYGNGTDSVDGGDGNDQINGERTESGYIYMVVNDPKTAHGGNGDDLVIGGNDNDELYGDAGDDFISGLQGNDTIDGGTGKDSLSGDEGNDVIFGNDGDDLIYGDTGDDKLYGGSGVDRIVTTSGNDTVEGGDGNDQINGLVDNNDPINGFYYYDATGNLLIHGDAGNDAIVGGTGMDSLYGDVGNDYLYGRSADDVLEGGVGDDFLQGDEGNDSLVGGAGTDVLLGMQGNDTLRGGSGDDYYSGGSGDDTYYIDDAFDTLYDLSGNDTAYVSKSFLKIPSTIENVIYTNEAMALPYWISALLEDASTPVWLATELGPADTYNYVFPTKLPGYYSTTSTEANGFTAFTAEQKSLAVGMLAQISAYTPLRFTEGTAADAPNTIAFAFNTQTGTGGYANGPAAGYYGSDVFINVKYSNDSMAIKIIGLHEIGHALGLKHPFSGADATGDTTTPPYLQGSENATDWTVMSYTDPSASYDALDYGPLDIAALQYLYGVNPTARANNDTYFYSESTPNFIWDGNGVDTIDASSSGKAVHIFLEPGYWGYSGSAKANTITSAGQITVNFGTVIENLIGSTLADQLEGNQANNLIKGGAGNDTINGGAGNDHLWGGTGINTLDGGAGIDVANYDFARADGSWSKQNGSIVVTSKTGTVTDTLAGVERLWFKDSNLALDLDGNAGKAVKITSAIYGKSSVANTGLIGWLLGQLDSGKSYNDVINAAISSKFGSKLDPTTFVSTVYKNVAGVAPDKAILDYYSSLLTSGSKTSVDLALIGTEHPANVNTIQVLGLPTTGLEYTV